MHNPDIPLSTDDDSCYSDVSYQTHVVTLKKVSMINDKSTVSVELCPESDNPYDSRAMSM